MNNIWDLLQDNTCVNTKEADKVIKEQSKQEMIIVGTGFGLHERFILKICMFVTFCNKDFEQLVVL